MSNQTVKKKAKKQKRNPWILRLILLFWFGLILSVVAIYGILFATSQGVFGKLPDVKDLDNPDINVASEIYSADGVLIDRYEKEKRIPIVYSDIPQHLVEALYSREDARYRTHTGVDGRALLRAIFRGATDGGGSTITQQLAKQLFSKRPHNKIERIKQKLKEWVVATQLEKRYTKDEIITMYLNKFDFIYRANGIAAAARTYYQKELKDLNLNESATLIAMLKNPIIYNPVRHPEKAKHERNVVINQMVKYEYLDEDEAEKIKKESLNLNFKMMESSIKETYSAYFKYAMRRELEAYLKEYEDKYGIEYNLYRDGLKIYTSIDSKMQKMGEKAIKKHLKKMQRTFFATQKGRKRAPFYGISEAKRQRIFEAAMRRTEVYAHLKKSGKTEEQILEEFNKPRDSVSFFTWEGKRYEKNKSLMDSIIYHKHIIQAGLMSMDPKDGTIKAWVGGIDWDYFKYDHVKQAKRQVGSTFKPLVYATAIHQMNYSPCHRISNKRLKVGSWRPKNAGYPYTDALSLRKALAHSVNMVTIRLILESGPEAVIQLAREMGIKNDIPKNATIALGSADLTLYEMVGAYGTFANSGIYVKPEIILQVVDKNGKIIKEHQPETREIFNEEVTYTMIDLMKGVVKMGTGKGIRRYGISSEVAGKTGTTNDGADSWFMGMVPNLVTGVWVGNEDPFAHFNTALSQGAKMALPIWAYYMKSVYKDGKRLGIKSSDKFQKPKGIEDKWDCENMSSFYDFGELGNVSSDNSQEAYIPEEETVNEMLTSDNDSVSFE